MMFYRIALAALFLISSSFCLAQANLAFTDDGKLVGWLLGKRSNAAGEITFQYLTPDGYIMSLRYFNPGIPHNYGSLVILSNSLGTVINELLYESDDCSGQAWVRDTHELIGEIAQLGVNGQSPVFIRTGFDAFSYPVNYDSRKDATGVCTNEGRGTVDGIFVTEIDPSGYGFIFRDRPPIEDGIWIIPSKDHSVQSPNALFCNGFESCPTE